jgi:hypothetical protein
VIAVYGIGSADPTPPRADTEMRRSMGEKRAWD